MALNKKKAAQKNEKDAKVKAALDNLELAPPATSNATQQMVTALNATDTTLPTETSVNVDTDKLGRTDKGLGLNQNGTYRQSNAGRKKATRKKRQIALTLSPNFLDEIDAATQDKSRSTTSYIAEFLERHQKELLKFINK